MPRDLLAALLELDELLGSVDEEWWRSKFREAHSMSGHRQAEFVLKWYGGMGSFNDLILAELNGHLVSEAEYCGINDNLDHLRSVIWDLATQRIEN